MKALFLALLTVILSWQVTVLLGQEAEAGHSAERKITAEDYCQFLNEIARDDSYSLYDEKMANDSEKICIRRTGKPGSYYYEAIQGEEHIQINFVSWRNIVQYCDWLKSSYFLNPNLSLCAGELYDQDLKSNYISFDIISASRSGAFAQQSSGAEMPTAWFEIIEEGVLFSGLLAEGVREGVSSETDERLNIEEDHFAIFQERPVVSEQGSLGLLAKDTTETAWINGKASPEAEASVEKLIITETKPIKPPKPPKPPRSISLSFNYQESIAKEESSTVLQDVENKEAKSVKSPLSLNDFIKAMEDYPTAARLIICDGIIQACDSDPNAPGKNRSENKTIVDALKAVIQPGLADDLLRYNNAPLSLGVDSLSAKRLCEIIYKAGQAEPAQLEKENTTYSEADAINTILDSIVFSEEHTLIRNLIVALEDKTKYLAKLKFDKNKLSLLSVSAKTELDRAIGVTESAISTLNQEIKNEKLKAIRLDEANRFSKLTAAKKMLEVAADEAILNESKAKEALEEASIEAARLASSYAEAKEAADNKALRAATKLAKAENMADQQRAAITAVKAKVKEAHAKTINVPFDDAAFREASLAEALLRAEYEADKAVRIAGSFIPKLVMAQVAQIEALDLLQIAQATKPSSPTLNSFAKAEADEVVLSAQKEVEKTTKAAQAELNRIKREDARINFDKIVKEAKHAQFLTTEALGSVALARKNKAEVSLWDRSGKVEASKAKAEAKAEAATALAVAAEAKKAKNFAMLVSLKAFAIQLIENFEAAKAAEIERAAWLTNADKKTEVLRRDAIRIEFEARETAKAAYAEAEEAARCYQRAVDYVPKALLKLERAKKALEEQTAAQAKAAEITAEIKRQVWIQEQVRPEAAALGTIIKGATGLYALKGHGEHFLAERGVKNAEQELKEAEEAVPIALTNKNEKQYLANQQAAIVEQASRDADKACLSVDPTVRRFIHDLAAIEINKIVAMKKLAEFELEMADETVKAAETAKSSLSIFNLALRAEAIKALEAAKANLARANRILDVTNKKLISSQEAAKVDQAREAKFSRDIADAALKKLEDDRIQAEVLLALERQQAYNKDLAFKGFELAQAASEKAQAAITNNEIEAWSNVATSHEKTSEYSNKAIAEQNSGKIKEAKIWSELALQNEKASEQLTKAAIAFAAGKEDEGAYWRRAGNVLESAGKQLEQSIGWEVKRNLIVSEAWSNAAKQSQFSSTYFAKAAVALIAGKKGEAVNCNDAGNSYLVAAQQLEKSIKAEAGGRHSVAQAWSKAAQINQLSGEHFAKAVTANAAGKLDEGTNWHDAGLGLGRAAEQTIKAAVAEAHSKTVEASAWRDAAQLNQLSIEPLTKAATAYATGNIGAFWSNQGNAYLRAAQQLEKAIEAEASNKTVVANAWRDAAHLNQQFIEVSTKSLTSYFAKKEGEGSCWKNAGNALLRASERAVKIIEAEADEKLEIAKVWKEAKQYNEQSCKFFTDGAMAFALGKSSEGTAWSNIAFGLFYAAEQLQRAIEAEAGRKPKIAKAWIEASQQSQRSCEFFTRSAAAHIAGKTDEGGCWENIGNALLRAAEQAAKAVEAEVDEKPEIAKAWREVVQQNQQSCEYSTKGAMAFAATKANEGIAWNRAGLSLIHAATQLQKAVEANKSEIAKAWRAASQESQRSCEHFTKAATVYITEKVDEGHCLLNAGLSLFNASRQMGGLIEAEVNRASGLASALRDVIQKNQQSFEYSTKGAAAFVAGKVREGWSWNHAGHTLLRAAEQAEKAINASNIVVANSYRDAAMQYQICSVHFADAARKHGSGLGWVNGAGNDNRAGVHLRNVAEQTASAAEAMEKTSK